MHLEFRTTKSYWCEGHFLARMGDEDYSIEVGDRDGFQRQANQSEELLASQRMVIKGQSFTSLGEIRVYSVRSRVPKQISDGV